MNKNCFHTEASVWMFIVVLFVIIVHYITLMYTNCGNPFIHYSFSNKRNNLLIYAATWMILQGNMLRSKTRQAQKIPCYMIQFIWHSWNVKTVVMDKRWVVTQDYKSWKNVIFKAVKRLNICFFLYDGTGLYLDFGGIIKLNIYKFSELYTHRRKKVRKKSILLPDHLNNNFKNTRKFLGTCKA